MVPRGSLSVTHGFGNLDGGGGVRDVAHRVLRAAAVGEAAGVFKLDPIGGFPVEIQDGAVSPLARRAHLDPVFPEDQRRLGNLDTGREGDLGRGAPEGLDLAAAGDAPRSKTAVGGEGAAHFEVAGRRGVGDPHPVPGRGDAAGEGAIAELPRDRTETPDPDAVRAALHLRDTLPRCARIADENARRTRAARVDPHQQIRAAGDASVTRFDGDLKVAERPIDPRVDQRPHRRPGMPPASATSASGTAPAASSTAPARAARHETKRRGSPASAARRSPCSPRARRPARGGAGDRVRQQRRQGETAFNVVAKIGLDGLDPAGRRPE